MIGLPRDSTWTHNRLLPLMKILNSIILPHFALRLMHLSTHKRAAHPPIILLMIMLTLMFTMIESRSAPLHSHLVLLFMLLPTYNKIFQGRGARPGFPVGFNDFISQ